MANLDNTIKMDYSRPFHNNDIITRYAYAGKSVKSENVEFHIALVFLHVVTILCQSIRAVSNEVSIRCVEYVF